MMACLTIQSLANASNLSGSEAKQERISCPMDVHFRAGRFVTQTVHDRFDKPSGVGADHRTRGNLATSANGGYRGISRLLVTGESTNFCREIPKLVEATRARERDAKLQWAAESIVARDSNFH
jgi:hypothetical protein